jgi:hypothetical protein
MLKVCKSVIVLGLAVAILLAGCGLISVTFLLDEDISQTDIPTDLYYYGVDVTDEEDWEDHVDDIEQINWVSWELFLTNPGVTDITFDGYIDDIDNPICFTTGCASATTRVLKDITIPAGESRHITMGESFSFMENIDVAKTLAIEGQFHFYGVSDGAFSLDSGRVVVAVVVVGT